MATRADQSRRTFPKTLLPSSPAPITLGALAGLPEIRSTPTTPFVSVVIVNYNGKIFLQDCLSSLEAQTFPREQWEAILVDNGSGDDSLAWVAAHFPWVRLIDAGKNLGFAAGNNVAIREARGDLIALLNNDTVVDRNWLAALVEEIQQDERIGGVASKLLFKDRPGTINSAGLNLYRDGRGGDRGFRHADVGQFEEPAEVFGACGASVLLRRTMLADVGLFDERLFMYCEDLDLAWRAHLRGWRFRYTPRSVVHHVHCGTSGEWSPFFIFYAERNGVLVNLKNASCVQLLRAIIGFGGRGAKKWFRVLTLQRRGRFARAQAAAYFRSLFSLAREIPHALRQRFLCRGRYRLAADRDFDHLITARPMKPG